MRPRILITGVGGFSGRHLAERLRAIGEVFGLGRSPTAGVPLDGYFACDLTDAATVRNVVDEVRPDHVYHLAVCATTAPAAEHQAVIVDGFRNLLAALKDTTSRNDARVKLLVVGSAAELGTPGTQILPAAEDAPCEPASDYGRAKLAVTRLVRKMPPSGNVAVVEARTFNLVGPGMNEALSLGHFAQQIAAVRRGENDRIRCGNLEHRRDYVDVRDAVAGYQAVLERGRPGEIYNICSGRSWQLGELLRWMLRLAGVESVPEANPNRPQAGDLPDVYGDPRKSVLECGWRATTPMERSLSDLLSALPVASA